MPCSGPRGPRLLRSASSASAMASASGLISITDRSAGTASIDRLDPPQVQLGDLPRGVAARRHPLLELGGGGFLERERGRPAPAGCRRSRAERRQVQRAFSMALLL